MSGNMMTHDDVAILLRSASLSRHIESALGKAGIAYRMVGELLARQLKRHSWRLLTKLQAASSSTTAPRSSSSWTTCGSYTSQTATTLSRGSSMSPGAASATHPSSP